MFAIINIISSCHRRIEIGRRQQTLRFCQSVLNRENKQICDVIEEHNFSPLNVAGLKLTKDTFDDSFKSVCEELFKLRPVHTSYIIVVFAYAMKLDEYHLLHSKPWYETDLLTCSLADVLIANGFEVSMRNRCILL